MKKILLSAIAVSAFAILGHAQISGNGLVARYSFNNGNANNDIGTNHGSVSGATLAQDRFGNPNKAYSFDGAGNFISLGSSTTIKPTVGSVSLWVKMTAVSNSGTGFDYNPVYIAKNLSNNNNFFEACGLSVSRTNRRMLAITTSFTPRNEKYTFSSGTVSTTVWQHYVITYNNDSLALYVDGALQSKIYKGFASTFSSTEPVYLGKSGNSTNNRYFNGLIDDVCIYNRVLTPAEVRQLYNDVDFSIISSTEEVEEVQNKISLFPNPTSGVVNFSEQVNARVTNITGQVIADEKQVSLLDISNLPSGLYFVSIIDEEGKTIQNSKVIKE